MSVFDSPDTPDERDIDRELRELVAERWDTGEDLTRLAGWEVTTPLPPAVLRIRAVDFKEPLIGRRAQFCMTSYDQTGRLIGMGWRDSLRIISEVEDLRGHIDRVVEPCVWVQEESDYYRTLAGKRHLPRFAAGISRVWVEQYVSLSHRQGIDPHDASNPDAWLGEVVRSPGRPRLKSPLPARRATQLVGRRVIHLADGGIETDLRAASEPFLRRDGALAATVVSEADWYVWSGWSNNAQHPSMREAEIASLWAED